jgi:hypothetical protein
MHVATIEVRPAENDLKVLWLYWVEQNTVVARLNRDLHGRCTVTPLGPHWNPMKSISQLFNNADQACEEVKRYFERR